MISGLTVTGAVIGQTWPYYCMLGATAAQLSWQICTLKIDEPDDCWTKFKSNQRPYVVGALPVPDRLSYQYYRHSRNKTKIAAWCSHSERK
uniref:Secreted protein n=1 Tax=Parascaris equorum TaxID=6256 RepID=A0A914SAB6_PAREQ